MRPKRKSISTESLNLIGIPKKFHNAKLDDVSTNTESRKKLKSFIRISLNRVYPRTS